MMIFFCGFSTSSALAAADASFPPMRLQKNQVQDFCTRTERYGLPEYVYGLGAQEIFPDWTFDFEPFLSGRRQPRADDAWNNSLYPDEALRVLNHVRFNGHGPLPPTHSQDLSNDTIDRIMQYFFDNADQQRDVMLNGNKTARAVCSDFLGLLGRNPADCATALRFILKEMSPRGNYSLHRVFFGSLKDARYSQAAASLSSAIEEKIKRGGTPDGNLWQDTLASFEGLTSSETERTDLALKLLALYSTNGPSTYYCIRNYIGPKTVGLLNGLRSIGTGITVLNSRSSGQLYTLPPEFSSQCDNGKPYHFWMSAYLAYAATLETGNPIASATAAMIAQLGYQMRMFREDVRDPTRVFWEHYRAPYADKIRIDLAHAMPAAWWGAYLGKNQLAAKPISEPYPKTDLDELLITLVNRSKRHRPLSAERAAGIWERLYGIPAYLKWKSIMGVKPGWRQVRKSAREAFKN